MFKPSARRPLPIVACYLPVPLVGAALSVLWNVGASPETGAGDMFLLGTALTPPLFLPALLLIGAVAARSDGPAGRAGAILVSVVSVMFLGGSTANLPNDLIAAQAAGSPLALTVGLAVVHVALSVSLLANALPRAFGRTGGTTSAVETAAAA
jgi:hypothetical protein